MPKLFTNMDADRFGVVGLLLLDDGRKAVWLCHPDRVEEHVSLVVEDGVAAVVDKFPEDVQDVLDDPVLDVEDILGRPPEEYTG